MTPRRKTSYTKPWLSCQDQLRLLASRGLAIGDADRAATTLSHLEYYRFSGYCLAFEVSRHEFAPGVSFDDVYSAYEFDRGLRRLLTEALEWIEIDFRTVLAHEFAQRHGPFGHRKATLFAAGFDHALWIERARETARRSSEVFVTHYRGKYQEFPDLPIWALVEILSFGSVSKLFKGMLRDDQRPVGRRYARQPSDLSSWLHHLSYMRNSCAHYARVWDRVHPIAPKRPAGNAWSTRQIPQNNRVFMTLLVLASLLSRVDALAVCRSSWARRVERHISDSTPRVQHAWSQMGIPSDWTDHPEWRQLCVAQGEVQ